MDVLAAAENGFRLKGIWWMEEAFTDVLRTVLSLRRAINDHRMVFHFGVSEKAVRKLRARSDIANGVILRLIEEAKLSSSRPAQYRERSWYNNYPEDIEARKILIVTEEEGERQRVVRHEQRKQRARRVTGGTLRLERTKARRHEAVQCCKRSGLTQVLTAESLSCSLSTVRRYW